jgi:polyhydroxyalkanoate synthase
VHERPVLVVPPQIGRFYFLDLRPGRSFVEYAASRGLRTFLISWRNPAAVQGSWDLDTYAARVSAAIDTVREITGSPDVNLMGFCAGGIIATTVLNHLAATGDDRVHSMSYAVTLLDFGLRAPITAFSGRGLIAFAGRRSMRKGIITSRQIAGPNGLGGAARLAGCAAARAGTAAMPDCGNRQRAGRGEPVPDGRAGLRPGAAVLG